MARVLVTGGAGFIGRRVVAACLAAGHEVRAFDALIDQVHAGGGDGRPEDLPREAEFMQGDMRDAEAVRHAIEGCDAVIHLAAEVGVGQSMYEIARYVGANDLGTAVLLDAVLDHPVRRVIVASSMSVYGEGLYVDDERETIEDARRSPDALRNGIWDPVAADGAPLVALPTPESKRVDLASIYALTKYAQERAVMIFGQAYETETVALRLFNVFGAGQALSNPYTGVLANFAARLANGQAPTVFEDGRQQRDFVHVEDVAQAFVLALDTPEAAGEVFNIGSGRAYSILEVASLLAEAMEVPELQPEVLGKFRAGDIRNCFADILKAQGVLGFEPRHRLEDTLEPFVEWVRGEAVVDRNEEMRRHLESRRLVS